MEAQGLLANIKPADLPAPPQAALRIMRACAKDVANHSELSKLAASDPLLTAELLRVVNSPFFGLGNKVQSIARAITIVGQRSLRNLALCLSVRDALAKTKSTNFDTSAFWEDALRRGVCARLLGTRIGLDGDECFTAGLLQDFGLLVLFYVKPQAEGVWQALRALDPPARRNREQELFAATHDQAGAMLARTWGLPENLMEAIEQHHDCRVLPPPAPPQLCHMLWAADWMAAIFTAADKPAALRACRTQLQDRFGLTAQDTADMLATVSSHIKSAADALGLGVGEQPDFAQILREANITLAEANLSFQELTWRLENALKERDALQAQLSQELEWAREIQQSLLPVDHGAQFPVTGINVAARQLSGDFYDYFALPDGRIYFNVGDVSGKGINAALLMAKTSSLFRCLGKRLSDPGELLGMINNELCETSVRGMFVTMAAGIYDPQTGNVAIANAGHIPVILAARNGRFAKLEAQGPPLGVVANVPMPVRTFNLADGSLYLFSDGVTEGHLESGQELGIKGLLDLFGALTSLPPRARLDDIVGRFTHGKKPLRDDITMVLVENHHG